MILALSDRLRVWALGLVSISAGERVECQGRIDPGRGTSQRKFFSRLGCRRYKDPQGETLGGGVASSNT